MVRHHCGGNTENELHRASNGSRKRIQRPGLGAERLPGRWILREPLPALWESILSITPTVVPHHNV